MLEMPQQLQARLRHTPSDPGNDMRMRLTKALTVNSTSYERPILKLPGCRKGR